jgi:hypothetical protein
MAILIRSMPRGAIHDAINGFDRLIQHLAWIDR